MARPHARADGVSFPEILPPSRGRPAALPVRRRWTEERITYERAHRTLFCVAISLRIDPELCPQMAALQGRARRLEPAAAAGRAAA